MNNEMINYIDSVSSNLIDNEYYLLYKDGQIVIESIYGEIENWQLDQIQQAINGHRHQQMGRVLINVKNLLN